VEVGEEPESAIGLEPGKNGSTNGGRGEPLPYRDLRKFGWHTAYWEVGGVFEGVAGIDTLGVTMGCV